MYLTLFETEGTAVTSNSVIGGVFGGIIFVLLIVIFIIIIFLVVRNRGKVKKIVISFILIGPFVINVAKWHVPTVFKSFPDLR